ncbi:hypothetical protein SUGI_0267500 [Cryptomeria japonica]|nr:hypothetical protein SUGI_0267500 [Cryptomeria japonica]
MGSEGRPGTVIHVTGFKKFHGVAGNPTETVVGNLREYVGKRGLPNGVTLGSCTVIETAGKGALNALYTLLNSAFPSNEEDPQLLPESSNAERIIWLHLGVNAGATKFAVECRALNEATFLYPDELGWQPQREPIVPEDGDTSHIREASLPVNEIVQALIKKGYDVTASNDAGRFVCNYVAFRGFGIHLTTSSAFGFLWIHTHATAQ